MVGIMRETVRRADKHACGRRHHLPPVLPLSLSQTVPALLLASGAMETSGLKSVGDDMCR